MNGDDRLYFDGRLLSSPRANFENGKVVPTGGYFAIGQEQDYSPGGGFVAAETLLGSMTGFNLWDHVIKGHVIAAMAKGSGREVGNVLGWTQLKNTIVGSLSVVPKVTASSIGKLQKDILCILGDDHLFFLWGGMGRHICLTGVPQIAKRSNNDVYKD